AVDPRVVLAISAAATLVFVVVDLRDARFRSSWTRDRVRLRRNAAFLVANLATMAALNVATHAIQTRVPRLIVWPHGSIALDVVEVIACVVVAELVNWVSHFVKHRQPWLWTF